MDQALAAARAASSKLATDIVILDVRPLIGITDYFVICSGRNERQVATIVEEIEEQLGAEGVKAYRREGDRQARWVLLDYLDFVVHVFNAEARGYYALEEIWGDKPVKMKIDVAPVRLVKASAPDKPAPAKKAAPARTSAAPRT